MPSEYANRGRSTAITDAGEHRPGLNPEDASQILTDALNRATVGLMVVGADGTVMAANETVAGWSGGTAQQMVGRPIWHFVVRITEENWPWRWQALVESGVLEVETMTRAADGVQQPTRAVLELQRPPDAPPRALIRISASVRRVGGQTAALDWHRSVAAYGEEGYWSWDVASGRISVSPRWCELLGLGARTTVTLEMMRAILGPQDFARLLADSARMARGELDHSDAVVALRQRGGETVWIRHRAHVASRATDGRVTRIVGRAVDVTEERQAVDSLRELVERVPVALLVYRANGSVRLWNRALADLLGCTMDGVLDEVERRRSEGWGLIDERGDPVPREGLPSLMALETGQAIRDRVYGLFPRGADVPRWGMLSALPRLDAGGQVLDVVTTFTDITTHRRLEQALADTRRLDGLGRLAGGLAHDFNNLLTVVTGNAEVIRLTAPEHPGVGESVDDILAAAERGATLVQQLLGYARKQETRPRPVPLGQRTRLAGALLGRVLGPGVQLVLPDEDGPMVWVDPHQFEQVVLELAVNAQAAMDGGGTLTLSVDRVGPSHSAVGQGSWPVSAFESRTDGRCFGRLRVIDDGVGMAPEAVAVAFEPFFTAGPGGAGHGLGLATCYGIVRQNGGYIRLHSAPGEGTTVEILLREVGG